MLEMNNYVQRMVCITLSVTGDTDVESPVRAEQGMVASVWNLSVKEAEALWSRVLGLQDGSAGKRAFCWA